MKRQAEHVVFVEPPVRERLFERVFFAFWDLRHAVRNDHHDGRHVKLSEPVVHFAIEQLVRGHDKGVVHGAARARAEFHVPERLHRLVQ